ncbi:MAG: CPBP family glutamic-type intramembrane protease [Novosphingobium sp.]
MIGRFSRLWTRTGLRIVPRDGRAAIRDAIAAVVGVTLFVVALDALLFRPHLASGYVTFYTGPLLPRVWVVSMMAAIEEIEFRLLLMTGLAILVALARGRVAAPVMIAIVVAAQFANVGDLVLADPLYATLRYWLVGCVWGWLYWRHGWLAALAGHVAVHPLLDPLLAFALTVSAG